MRKLLVAMLMAACVLPAAPSYAFHKCGQPPGTPPNPRDCRAHTGAFVGTAHLPTFPCPGTCTGGTFTATVVGGGADISGNVVLFDRLTATFSYSEGCTNGEPLTGTASGSATLWSGNTAIETVSFSWTRAGLGAVIGGEFVGVAVFLPSPLPACGSSTAINATVAGWFSS